ncbi:DOPA-like domain-containing protein [Pisolithus croceorrhizus]|nr:DOPA-like domain-containing protein [Pisolithus croceorrhizus]
MPTNPVHVRHVLQLHQRILSEFPELPIYRISDGPKGPHPTATFKVLTNTPHQTGALFGWLVVNRGPVDILVHPNRCDTYRDHAELASWIGQP